MTFKEATDRAQALGITGETLAAHFGVRPNTYRAFRFDGPNGRTPPAGWEETLVKAVTERMEALEELRHRLVP